MLSSKVVKQLALSIGFDDCGIASAEAMPQFAQELTQWLAEGGNASMRFMEQHTEKRADPRQLVPGAKSIISVVLGYRPSQTLSQVPRIAQYAYLEDYHTVIKRMLFALIAAIREHEPDFVAKPCVDTVPISDKLWAWRAGLGWIGRNTMLVHPVLGTYCYIGALVTPYTVDEYDNPLPNRCGTCRRCLDACPNHALRYDVERGTVRLDANCCASYHTIENRDSQLPANLKLSGYAFGCDVCQLACPCNSDAPVRQLVSAQRLQELQMLPSLSAEAFAQATKGSAMSRISFAQWQRNLRHLDEQNG